MNRIRGWRLPALMLVALLAALAFGPVCASESEAGGTVNWSDVFDSDGSLRFRPEESVPGGVDAIFIEDRVSGGGVADISAIRHAADPDDSLVVNAPLAAPHDIGNAYVVARLDGTDLVLDVRVERLAGETPSESFVEVEFNRDLVAVSSGHRFPLFDEEGYMVPGYELRWPFRGGRTTADFLVRLDLLGSIVRSVEFMFWDGATSEYVPLESDENFDDAACFGITTLYSVCSGPLDDYIANGDPEQVYRPDSFVELSVNVARLLGVNTDFTTIQVRSPEDIAFGTFTAFGRFASPVPAARSHEPRGVRIRRTGAGDEQ